MKTSKGNESEKERESGENVYGIKFDSESLHADPCLLSYTMVSHVGNSRCTRGYFWCGRLLNQA